MEFGKKLKEEREKQGYSLEAIEEQTKIRKAYIKALEDEDFSLLPPRVYAVGFLKLYASFLKLDSEEMVNELKALAYSPEEDEESSPLPAAKKTEIKWPSSLNLKNILAAGVFLILIVWIGNYLVGYFANQAAKEKTAPPPRPSVSQQSQEKVKPPKTVVNKADVVIEATQKCWLSVVVDGQKQYEGILNSGQTKSFKGKKSVVIKAGNAGGISITFNNKKLGPMGSNGEVIEKEFLAEKTTTE